VSRYVWDRMAPPVVRPYFVSLGGKAVEESVTTSAAQVTLAAASPRAPARHVKNSTIATLHRRAIPCDDVTNHCRALGAARPIPAGTILAWGKSAAFGSQTSQHVMTIWCKAYARDDLAPLAQ